MREYVNKVMQRVRACGCHYMHARLRGACMYSLVCSVYLFLFLDLLLQLMLLHHRLPLQHLLHVRPTGLLVSLCAYVCLYACIYTQNACMRADLFACRAYVSTVPLHT